MQHTRRVITRARRRRRVGRALHALGWAWLIAAVAAVLGAFGAAALGYVLLWWVYPVGFGVALVAAVAWAWTRPDPDRDLAGLLDEELGLKDRLGTALYAADQSDHPFAQSVIDEAENAARGAPVAEAVPVVLPDVWRWTVAAGAVALVLIVFLPGTFDPFGLNEKQQQAEAQREAELAAQQHIEEALNLIELDEPDEVDPAAQDPEDLMERLETVLSKRDLNTPEARQDAEAELSQLRDHLKELAEAQKAQDQAMQQSLSGLETSGRGPADRFIEALRRGDYDQARQALEEFANQLDNGDLSETQKEQLEQQLDELAEQLEAAAEQQQQAAQAAQQQIQQQLQNAGMSQQQAQQLAQQMTQQGVTSQQVQQQLQNAGMSQQQAQQLANQTQQARQQAQQCQGNGNASQNLSNALGQMSQAMKQGQSASSGSQSAQQQLGQMAEQMAQSQQMAHAQRKLQQAQQQLGQNAGMPGGTRSGVGGREAGNAEGGHPIGAERSGAGYNAVAVIDAQEGNGKVISSWQRGGEVAPGEATVQFQSAITEAQAAAERAVTDDRAPRRYHKAIERYFNRMPATPQGGEESASEGNGE